MRIVVEENDERSVIVLDEIVKIWTLNLKVKIPK